MHTKLLIAQYSQRIAKSLKIIQKIKIALKAKYFFWYLYVYVKTKMNLIDEKENTDDMLSCDI